MPDTPQQRVPATPRPGFGARSWLWGLVATPFAFSGSAQRRDPASQPTAYREFKAPVHAGQAACVSFAGRKPNGASELAAPVGSPDRGATR
jgi:hypothetical protein